LAPFGNTAGNEYSALSICVKEKRPGYRNYTFNKNVVSKKKKSGHQEHILPLKNIYIQLSHRTPTGDRKRSYTQTGTSVASTVDPKCYTSLAANKLLRFLGHSCSLPCCSCACPASPQSNDTSSIKFIVL
jgi:hypothetical protein